MKLYPFWPASRFDLERFEKGVDLAKELGFEVLEAETQEPHWFYAAPLEKRLEGFQRGVESKAVMVAVRGGYGSVELLDHLEPCRGELPLVVGYSDVTALHAHISNAGGESVHGPMLATASFLESSPAEKASWVKCIRGEGDQRLELNGAPFQRRGRLVGGNLTVLATLMGTPWQLRFQRGDVLLLEDVNEAPYALARSLRQLSNSHGFSQLHILWGHLTNCGDVPDLLDRLMEPYSNTCQWGLPLGHENPNFSLRLGREVSIEGQELRQSLD